MVCRLYKAAGMSRCLAVKGDHIPLVREREQHCMKGGPSCPVLAAFLQQGHALDQEQHLEVLWRVPEGKPEGDLDRRPDLGRAAPL